MRAHQMNSLSKFFINSRAQDGELYNQTYKMYLNIKSKNTFFYGEVEHNLTGIEGHLDKHHCINPVPRMVEDNLMVYSEKEGDT